LEYSSRIPDDIVVPEAQNTESSFLQVRITSLVSSAFGVLASISFNNEHLFEGDEVNNPGSNRYLSAEFRICQLP
jgi:hypothetical protein